MVPWDDATLSYFACDACGGDLALRRREDGEPLGLRCERCASEAPFVAGVPRFVESEGDAGSFGYQWSRNPRTQLDSHTGVPVSRARLEAVTGWPEDLGGQAVLEAGSGAGRFTEVLVATGALVFSFDRSVAVAANQANNGAAPNLCLFQGDLLRLPLRRGTFDKVLCLGVLQHTEDPAAAFRSLARLVRPGGELVIDVYARRLRALLGWKYLLRPLTKRIPPDRLYRLTERTVDALLPLATRLRRTFGRAGARLLPILEYSHLGLPAPVNRDWAVLDTFDMYSPRHDHPQSLGTVRGWYREAGFEGVHVAYGPNGVTGRGRRPAATPRRPGP